MNAVVKRHRLVSPVWLGKVCIRMKKIFGLLLLLASGNSFAGVITINPGDYADGTNLSNISPYVQFSTTDGLPVYCASLSSSAAGGNSVLGFGSKVFSADPDAASEWWTPDWGGPGLQITFNTPVTYFSLLVAELFHDAAPGSDPVMAFIFDRSDNLLAALYVDEFNGRVNLGKIYEGEDPDWAYWAFEFAADNIGRIVIGGDSEPTTLGRLQFIYSEVSEPFSGSLLLLGLIGVLIRRLGLHKDSVLLAKT